MVVPSLDRRQVLAELKSSARGLSADEAAARRADVGSNRLPTARRRPVFQYCPVGHHWALVAPVRDSDLSDEDRRLAAEHHDLRVP
jgi:hypothetical protein